MKKILAIGASNSSKSINKVFASYISSKLKNTEVTVLDWSNLVLPLYNPDLEAEAGIPEKVTEFKTLINTSDGIVLSLAEHNGFQTAAFKNLWDWTSRIDQKFWQEKPMFLAATSPGGRGGASVLKATKDSFPYFGGNVITDFSLPSFYDNFTNGTISNEDLLKDLESKISDFQNTL